MLGDIRDTASGFHILRVGLLAALLLLGAGGCNLLDVLSVPGKSGGSIWLIVPLGLGGNVGILNPTAGQTTSNQTTNNGGSSTTPVPASVLSGPGETSASPSVSTIGEPADGSSGAATGDG